ncbi:MAG TPA: ATP-binding protein [Candidatus Paceibacterota bacterium]|jgi:signal transduction histidine kinase|nr:ATP-binding protein [Candidatus Paceibacterota bacterium]
MIFTLNLDLVSVGITTAGIGLLGFTIYFNNVKSITNKTFLAFSLLTIVWSIANYLQYQPTTPQIGLWIVRLIVFIGCWHALMFFQLCYVFPEPEVKFSRSYLYGLVPLVALTSILTLTPLVFQQVEATTKNGVVTQIQNGPAIPLFGILVVSLIVSGVITLGRKAYKRKGVERAQIAMMSLGTFLTFVCIVTFNIILPAAFNNPSFLPLSALFIFPLVACTAYAIFRYHLLNIKVLATEVVAFLLSVATLLELVRSNGLSETVFQSSVFCLVLAFSILMVRSVVKEVEQREQIEKLSEEKSEFMSFASHEIRNPITAMRGYASLVSDGTAGEVSAQVRDIAQKILVNGDTVLSLISEFLNKSKVELGQIAYNVADVDIDKTVRSIAEGLTSHAREKGLSLDVKIDFPNLIAKADEAKLREIVGNLVDNSVKYTKTGSVTVEVEKRNGMARIIVADTGVGIPPETLPYLFQKFSRADAQKMNLLGTGLGLYLAKTFIEGMGGRIWAESDGQGKGSRFIIELHTV